MAHGHELACHGWHHVDMTVLGPSVGPKPRVRGNALRNAIFLRRTGSWMLDTVDRLLSEFGGRIVTSGESAASVARMEPGAWTNC